MRRIDIVVALTFAVPSSALMMAAPASAATIASTINCSGGTLSATSNNFAAGSSDSIVLTNATGVGLARTSASGVSGPVTLSAAGPFSTGTYSVTGSSGGSISYQQDPSGSCANATITITFTGGGGGGGAGGGSSSGSATSSAPDPIVQQFGMPASGTCADTASESLNWGGASSGGWGESWAEWMHGGLGGAVCTRTLVYSTSSGAWTAS